MTDERTPRGAGPHLRNLGHGRLARASWASRAGLEPACLLSFCLAALISCGDPLVEGDYRGQPLISLSGTIRVNDSLSAEEAATVRVALLWIGAGQQEDLTQARSESAFPARYTLDVFTPPPARAMRELTDRDGLYALARIVLYLDADGDERLGARESMVGASPDQVLTYFTSSETTSLVSGSLRTGYQVMALRSCDDRLTDKAMLANVPTVDAVDLVLEAGVIQGLSDLDCDSIGDDFCYDLRLRVQEEPGNEELVQLYEDRCEVANEPAFNNESTTTEDPAMTEPDGTEPDLPLCERDPDHPDCKPDATEPTGDEVLAECKPLLTGAVGEGYDGQRSVYWQFAQCAESFDPCRELEWLGGEERFLEYRQCIFTKFPAHHEAFCHDLAERLQGEQLSTEDRAWLEEEQARAQCGDNV